MNKESLIKRRIFSGIRPTGHIHLGNYLGAIYNWIQFANNGDEQLYCIVDQHALTTAEDSDNLIHNTYLITAAYIACGIDPEKSIIFAQSHVPVHTELAWYLSCVTPLGWLNRMTQFKDKAGQDHEKAKLGLYAYPVLMAADILAYKATHIPVGEDQKQHIELARDLATVFNNHCKNDSLLVLPEPIILKESARIMSLRDGTKKMSKSDISDYSRIHLLDKDDEIIKKIKKAKTDSGSIPINVKELESRPEAYNLLNLYAILTKQPLQDVCHKFNGQSFAPFKKELMDILIECISPIRSIIKNLLNNKDVLDKILYSGAEKANKIAENNLNAIRQNLGMLKRKK